MIRILRNRYTAWLVLANSLFITLLAWWVSSNFSEELAAKQFDASVREMISNIDHRMDLYEQALWGGVGLYSASDTVTRSAWKHYIDSLKIANTLPGIQGIGVAPNLKGEDRDAHENCVRSDGFPDYRISPESERDRCAPVTFLEPFDWRNQRAFGYDMWSNDVRREALARAGDLGIAATSGMVRLLQETGEDVQNGFLTYVPLYDNGLPVNTVEERRQALRGWVFAAFRAKNMLQGALDGYEDAFHIQIFDAPDVETAALLFDSDPERGDSGGQQDDSSLRSTTRNLTIQGRSWTLRVQTEKFFQEGMRPILPWVIAIGGIIVSVLLFVLMLFVYGLKERASSIAAEMTRELEESNQELRQFAYAATHDVKSPLNSIGNALHLLNKESPELSKRSSKAIEWIHTAHGRAIEIIDKLTEVIHLKEGGKLEAETIDMGTEIPRITAAFANELAACGGAVDCRGCEGTLNFPPSVISRVMENLLSNAIKYRHPDRPLRISIDFTSHRTESILRVQDNGLGFDASTDQDKIFGLFRRAHSHVQGSGFGLYITKQSLEFHGASITCTSAVGTGSAFLVSIPS
ncbi:MAG: CHASE domain-containing protein [Verrucomicrobiae bacterium]|nr:CHASE domain-containing protein [Verrucomicrobiae bacterium]